MLEIKPMAGALGAEIHGLDLSGELAGEQVARLRALLNEYEVIFFRDQDIGPAAQKALALCFGPLQTHPAYETVEGFPELTILESTPEKPTKIEAWHSDMTFRKHPPMGTVLRSLVVPPKGGDTLWASMYAAYEALSEPMKQFLSGLTATHDFAYAFADSVIAQAGAEKLEAQRKKNPPTSHPVIRTHPETGRPLLYVSETFTSRINELSPAESKALLAMLVEHIRRPEFQVRITWEPGTLAFWDNRATQHYAARDYVPHHRVMHRVTLLGDAPFHRAA